MERECCAEADDIGPDGVKELEERLLSFRGYNNQIKSSAGSNQLGSEKHSIMTPCRRPSRYVPYKGTFVPYDGTYGAPDQGQMLDV